MSTQIYITYHEAYRYTLTCVFYATKLAHANCNIINSHARATLSNSHIYYIYIQKKPIKILFYIEREKNCVELFLFLEQYNNMKCLHLQQLIYKI